MTDIDPSVSKFYTDPSRIGWAINDLDDFSDISEGKVLRGRFLSPTDERRLRESSRFIVEAYRSGTLVASAPLLETLGLKDEDESFLLDRVVKMRGDSLERETAFSTEIETLGEKLSSRDENIKKYRNQAVIQSAYINEALELLRSIHDDSSGESTLARAIEIVEGLENWEPIEDLG